MTGNGIFDSTGFMPRTHCGTAWTPELVVMHRVSDLVIFAAYVVIPLLVIWRAKRGMPFIARDPIGLALLVGFVATCGLTHLSNQMMFVEPRYRLDALVKITCAAFSLAASAWMALDVLRRR